MTIAAVLATEGVTPIDTHTYRRQVVVVYSVRRAGPTGTRIHTADMSSLRCVQRAPGRTDGDADRHAYIPQTPSLCTACADHCYRRFAISFKLATTALAVGRASANSDSIDPSSGRSAGTLAAASARSLPRLRSSRISMQGMPSTMPMIMQQQAQMSNGVPYSAPRSLGSVDLSSTSGGLMYLFEWGMRAMHRGRRQTMKTSRQPWRQVSSVARAKDAWGTKHAWGVSTSTFAGKTFVQQRGLYHEEKK